MEEFKSLLTYIEIFSQNVQLIFKDLQRTEPHDLAMYPPSYDDTITLEMKFTIAK